MVISCPLMAPGSGSFRKVIVKQHQIIIANNHPLLASVYHPVIVYWRFYLTNVQRAPRNQSTVKNLVTGKGETTPPKPWLCGLTKKN